MSIGGYLISVVKAIFYDMRQYKDNSFDIRVYIRSLLQHMGRDFHTCELCQAIIPDGKARMHHTKYDKATIYDIKIVCNKCDKKSENKFLE